MSSDIPLARRKLMDIASRLKHIGHPGEASEILIIVTGLLTRKCPVRKAPVSANRVARRLKADIIAYAQQHRKVSFAKIAERFNVNPGRVSEILNGKK